MEAVENVDKPVAIVPSVLLCLLLEAAACGAGYVVVGTDVSFVFRALAGFLSMAWAISGLIFLIVIVQSWRFGQNPLAVVTRPLERSFQTTVPDSAAARDGILGA